MSVLIWISPDNLRSYTRCYFVFVFVTPGPRFLQLYTEEATRKILHLLTETLLMWPSITVSRSFGWVDRRRLLRQRANSTREPVTDNPSGTMIFKHKAFIHYTLILPFIMLSNAQPSRVARSIAALSPRQRSEERSSEQRSINIVNQPSSWNIFWCLN